MYEYWVSGEEGEEEREEADLIETQIQVQEQIGTDTDTGTVTLLSRSLGQHIGVTQSALGQRCRKNSFVLDPIFLQTCTAVQYSKVHCFQSNEIIVTNHDYQWIQGHVITR